MLNKFKRLYKKIPSSISLPFLKITGLAPIYSKKHWRKVKIVETTFNRIQIKEDLIKLNNQIKNVDYYSAKEYLCFKKNSSLENLKALPIIDTSIVRNNLTNFINTSIPGYDTTTGGSGRNPLKIHLSNKSYFQDRIYAFYAWSTLGYKRGDLKLTLRGVNLGDDLYQYNPMNNELLINIFLLNKDNLPEIIRIINKYKPVFGHGYPSAWYNLALLMKGAELKFNSKLKGIYFASETVDNTKRDFVEEIFNVPVRATYGFTERAAFAFELPKKKNHYLVALQYGLIEILKEDGSDAEVGERGEIVCTGFINARMPLIRYKTGDSAIVSVLENGIVKEIEELAGRWGKDFILDTKGNEIYTTAINVHSRAQFDFRYIQLYQKEPGELTVRCVPFSKIKPSSLKEINDELVEKLPTVSISTEVCELENLYISKRGKIPYLVKEK